MNVLAEFIAHLRRAAMQEQFVAVYESVARQLLAASPGVAPEQLGERDVEAFCARAKAAGATEQQLRNVRTATESFVWYLRNRSRPSLAPPAEAGPTDARAEQRVSFLREVVATGLGACRSSDLCSNGMFLETMAIIAVGNVLELSFLVENDDFEPVRLQARVVYTNPSGVGLAFRSVPPEARHKLARFLSPERAKHTHGG